MMRYITIAADYTGSCIREDSGDEIKLSELNLPPSFEKELASWHSAYKKIIPLSPQERMHRRDEIKKLDKIGLSLAQKLSKLISGSAKVKYYSEGMLMYLNQPP